MFDLSIYKTEQKELKAQQVFVVGTIGVLLVGVTIFLLYAYFRVEYQEEEYRKLIGQESVWVTQARATQTKQLTSYTVTDKEQKRVSIPIDQAISKVAAELGKN